MIVIPVFLVAGIIELIAENMNYNISPNKDPNMDIRVRREIKFDMNHPEEVDTPPDKNEQVSIIEVLRRHKFEQDIRPKRDAYSDVYPYETNIKYNNGILNNGTERTGTAKSESVIKTGYQLLMAAIFKPSKKTVTKLNTTYYNDGNYYNNGYEKQNNGNFKTVTPYNGYSPYKSGSYNNGVPNHGNSQSNGTSKTNGTTATTTEKPNIAQACIIMCNTFNCPENYTQMGFGCVPDSDYE